ncbi:MAG TPA: hypothetical protein VHN11_04835 [Xanthobacteraceae bacterium]|jgi:hypothetical protein|nr:hypothetical protein [Xanthobacteraceae bacterium]
MTQPQTFDQWRATQTYLTPFEVAVQREAWRGALDAAANLAEHYDLGTIEGHEIAGLIRSMKGE